MLNVPAVPLPVKEVYVVGMHSQDESTRDRLPRAPAPGFVRDGVLVTDTFTIVRYRAPRPVPVRARELLAAEQKARFGGKS